MTNEQKLKQIIDRAVKNGLDFKWYGEEDDEYDFLYSERYRILLCHDFAKAYWGENWHMKVGGKANNRCVCGSDCDWFKTKPYIHDSAWIKCWQYHLQQCVISDDIIDYYFTH